MRLRVVTPTGSVIEATDVVHVRAEDETGAFGIQPRHADFVTRLVVSVLSWREAKGEEHHAAIRGGVLRVRGGQLVEVATREAVVGEPLSELEHKVLARLRQTAEREALARTRATELHAALVRHLYRYVKRDLRGRPLRRSPGEPP